MKKQSFLLGSFILVASVLITKIIGLLFKIPLANILGGTGMGYFSGAYALFMPIYAASVTGLPAAVSRMVAENMAFERYSNVRKIRRVAVLSFSAVGVFCSLLLVILAGPFTQFIKNENAYLAVIAIAPCVFFGAVISVYRGYYEGMRNMFPTAISQIIESIIKLGAGLGLSYATLLYTEKTFNETGKVFGMICDSLEKSQQAALPYVAAAAIVGVTLSTGISLFYLLLRYRIAGDGITKEMLSKDKTTDRMRHLLKDLLSIVVPIALGSVITNLTSLIDLGTIIRCLNTTIENSPQYFMDKFSYAIDANAPLKDLPIFIYGSFTGLALTIFGLVPSLTNMFGKGILPNLAEAWAVHDKNRVNKNIHSVIAVTGLIAIPAGLGICAMANPILQLLYSARQNEIKAVDTSLAILGIGVIFLSLSIPIFAMLQAIGRADLPVKIMLFGVGIKLIGNLTLIYIPEINVDGAAISTTLCYAIICIVSLHYLKKITGVRFEISRLFVKPTFSGIMCAVTAYLCYDLTNIYLGIKLSALFSICAGGLIYLICLYLMNITNGKSIKEILKK